MQHPPKWLSLIFAKLCRTDLWEYIQGDLEELYDSWAVEHGRRKAGFLYAREVFGLIRPNLLKKLSYSIHPEIHTAMLKNYFKIAIRNLWSHRFFSGINVFGLAISMSICLLLLMLLMDQYSYDRFHENKNELYRIVSGRTSNPSKELNLATAPMPIAQVLKEEYPGVKEVVRIRRNFGGDAKANDKILPISGYYADQSFLEVFSFKWLKGNKSTALTEPNALVLTDETAKRFFGEGEALGQTVTVGEWGEFTVKGIIEKPPKRSHMQFQVLTSIAALEGFEEKEMLYPSTNNWVNLNGSYTYFLMEKGRSVAAIKEALPKILEDNYEEERGVYYYLDVQKFNNITPGPDFGNQLGISMPENILLILMGLVLVILISACFNYTNLSIARALTRAREVGIRKVVGAKKFQIIFQFLAEAVVISMLSLAIAAFMLEFLIPGFYSLHPEISKVIELTRSWEIYIVFLGFSVLVGIIAGFFPALHLSSFKPVLVLKGASGMKISQRMPLRKVLTVFQFTLSLVFIISVALAYRQLEYMNNMELGFQAENIVNIPLQGNDYAAFDQEVGKHKDIQKISHSNLIPATGSIETTVFINPESLDSLSIAHLYIDQNYFENMKIELLAGNNFPEDASTDHEQYIILNEIALKKLNYGEPLDALGKTVEVDGGDHPMTIIGVVKNFHFRDTYSPLGPLMIRYNPNRFHYANLMIRSENLEETLGDIESLWVEMDPVHEFSFEFFDDQVAETYTTLTIMIKVVGFTAFLAITLACLGLLGMATYVAETRLREVGIRKVLGASEQTLIMLLSKGFIWLLGISAIIAIPLAYFGNQIWLQEFAYRIDIGIGTILFATALLLGLGLLTIVSQTARAAKSNPIDVLRND